jgi:hypothetical protein
MNIAREAGLGSFVGVGANLRSFPFFPFFPVHSKLQVVAELGG